MSGLQPSNQKSTIFFCNVNGHVKNAILELMPFVEEHSCHNLEKYMRKFLWNAGTQGRAKAKVAWVDVCLPKTEGGLGIRSISDVNKALMTSHIWSIVTRRKSLWVDWIYDYKLKDRSFWDIQPRGSISWGWRKILAIRDIVRPFIWKEVRSGLQTNVWTDNWCHLSPLSPFITPRRIAQAGFSMSASVADLIDVNGQWKWPIAWYDLYPVLIDLDVPQLSHNMQDRIVWKDLEVWQNIKLMVSLDQVDDTWQSIMDWMFRHASSKKVEHIVSKLVIAATTYFIWLERNNCLFSNDRAKVESVVGRIKRTVRLRLMGFDFKGDAKVDRMLRNWEIAASEQEEDPG
ncbi:uncharacterized protein LOC110943107 [Helianthus annuus]|uniref:uncharacterized protein LOC110943107 n=1 Tax=Helianthus annuus TaxID=4232 RepID=UPI000B8F496D|nr:uncharacterized protein LOC110943107 [Helianthus annuus]